MPIIPQSDPQVKDVLAETERVRERNRQEYEALAQMTGQTIAEVEADLTAPDPGLECSVDYCAETPFRDSDLCFDHFIEEETAEWEAEREMRQSVLMSMVDFRRIT